MKDIKSLLLNLPFWVFLVLTFSLPFANWPIAYYGRYPIQSTDILFLFNVILWLFFVFWGKCKIRLSWFYLPLFLYFLSLCLSTYFSENQSISFTKLFGSTYLIGLAVLAFNLTEGEAKLIKISWAWLIATFLVSLVCVISLFLFYFDRDNRILLYTLFHFGSLPIGHYPRISGTLLNPNSTSNYFNISICLLLAMKNNWSGKTLIIFAIPFTISILLTLSPGIGGILLVLGWWFWLEFKVTKPLFSKIFLFLGLSGALLFFLSTLISPTNLPRQIEPSARVLTWRSACEIALNYPIVGRGVGLATADVFYYSPDGRQKLEDAHQLWLSIAAQQGIIGLVAIILLTGWFLRRIIPFKPGTDFLNLRTAFGLAFMGAFCYQGLTGSFEDSRHLWVLMGLLASSVEGRKGEE